MTTHFTQNSVDFQLLTWNIRAFDLSDNGYIVWKCVVLTPISHTHSTQWHTSTQFRNFKTPIPHWNVRKLATPLYSLSRPPFPGWTVPNTDHRSVTNFFATFFSTTFCANTFFWIGRSKQDRKHIKTVPIKLCSIMESRISIVSCMHLLTWAESPIFWEKSYFANFVERAIFVSWKMGMNFPESNQHLMKKCTQNNRTIVCFLVV